MTRAVRVYLEKLGYMPEAESQAYRIVSNIFNKTHTRPDDDTTFRIFNVLYDREDILGSDPVYSKLEKAQRKQLSRWVFTQAHDITCAQFRINCRKMGEAEYTSLLNASVDDILHGKWSRPDNQIK